MKRTGRQFSSDPMCRVLAEEASSQITVLIAYQVT